MRHEPTIDSSVPLRQVRAQFDEQSVIVYQAYSAAIAKPALAAHRFVPPFKRDRMTWIKPSFLWMMYRSGWATKPGQEHVLAITITRDGFEWALAHSSLSHFDPAAYGSNQSWVERKAVSPVRIQWDPERDLRLQRLPQRAIQVGLSGAAARKYVEEWTLGINDVTPTAHRVRDLVDRGDMVAAENLLPIERPYPLPQSLEAAIGVESSSR